MKTTKPHTPELTYSPVLSSAKQGWDNILLEQFQPPPGEGNCHYRSEHTICLSLSSRPVHFLQMRAGKTYTGLYAKGDISITPAQMPFFARWDSNDRYLQIRVPSHFIQNVAREALNLNPDRIELVSEFRVRDPQIEAIASLFLNELQQENVGGKLYIDSLSNVLAVHLIRQYATVQPQLSGCNGGLAQHQLRRVLDYINDYLEQEIKLADLAALLNMSQFHFSHLFKQSVGIAPHQYLLQQRVERAKQLLQHTDQSIMEIAFLCGFNSHSHLSKQFRQLTGMTPTTYRTNFQSISTYI